MQEKRILKRFDIKLLGWTAEEIWNVTVRVSLLQEGRKLVFVVRVQSAKGIPKRYTVRSKYWFPFLLLRLDKGWHQRDLMGTGN